MKKGTRIFIGIAILLGVLGLLFILFELSVVAVWDGHFKLNVNIHSRSSQPIHGVSWASYFRRKDADWVSQTDSHEPDYEFKAVKNFDGTRFVAFGQCWGRTADFFGIEDSYGEERFIVLRVDYVDGKQLRTVAEIPKGRGPRSTTVEIP